MIKISLKSYPCVYKFIGNISVFVDGVGVERINLIQPTRQYFKLELPFSWSSHSVVVFFPVGLSSLSRYSQPILLGIEVFFCLLAWTVDHWEFSINCPSRVTELQHATRHVENVVIMTKGLQERTQLLKGTKVKKR